MLLLTAVLAACSHLIALHCMPTQHCAFLLHFCHPPGNLLVLSDGRVGFIDFGIVGRVSPVTWAACEALLAAMATGKAWQQGRVWYGATRWVSAWQGGKQPE
jgi:hypothetical protein